MSMSALGLAVPFARFLPDGMSLIGTAQSQELLAGKDGLTLLGDRPLNAETPPHLLDDDITPTIRHFIRNNGTPPEALDPETWTLTVDGEVRSPLTLTVGDLMSDFEEVTLQLQLECGGNGRKFFDPPVSGNQWSYGAVACSAWTGVRYADVLCAAGIKDTAVYTAHYGADTHLSGNPDLDPISRGVPVGKAMDPHNLIAFGMNRGPLHPMNGSPLRAVIPGWPGSCSQKWLTRIWVRDRVHDGAKMTGTSYRVPRYPVAPGADVPEEDFEIIESMPVKSLITFPRTGFEVSVTAPRVTVRGRAWAGDDMVSRVDVTRDFGRTWQEAVLSPPANPYAWQRFSTEVTFPEPGYYEVWARATDDQGRQQPFAIAWNPKGYLNNAMHRVVLLVT